MTAYADTGFLCSLYAPDDHTGPASAWMLKQELPLVFTWLHQLELRNALRLRVFRGEISPEQRDGSLNAVLADLAAGVLTAASPPVAEAMTEAERLSALHSERLGTRTLDILHVAFALVMGSPAMITFDVRQAALARAAGLKVPTLPASTASKAGKSSRKTLRQRER